ncbi:TerB family tellurite resistance protein [Roseisalinus antarcticus]|uniref:Tellurite resistance protein TerB n=1 Tax=Roseisalinus antarcticus TaxID=254357 RepID=A0A1Y5STJ3_9RHOB|nr:TerB family tellurite resistance protein [Roseisalinus antarcticus]SLN47783.1 Tellurite resistance protein TerB [Roseisalinus antarcticus]
MFGDLLRRLTAPAPEPLPDTDARLALTALLVRLAKADGTYSAEEIARIDRIVGVRYGLNPVDSAKLRADAETLEHQAPDTVRFTRAIKDAVPYEDREAVIETLWEVVLADGIRDNEEDALLRMVAPMLGVADQDSALARQRVEGRLS